MYSQNRRTATSTAAPKTEAKKEAPKGKISDKSSSEKIAKEESSSNDPAASADKKNYPGKSFLNPQIDASKMSTTIEFGGYPSDADITIVNIYGHLGLNFDLGRRFHIGPYFRHKILSTHEYQVMQYKNIDYDVSSLKEWGTGLNLGVYFPMGNTLLLNPELRLGYNEFTIQNPNYSDVNTNFIYRNYINFTPRMNFGFKLSDYTIFNLHGGYTLPYFLNDPEAVPHFNPATFHYGLGLRFYLMK
jgi:hypothetical protein